MPGQAASNRTRRVRLTATARRALIEQAATEVFAERGYRGASMDEIAARSAVSVPVLYDHFKSKRELHRRLLERHFAELRQVWYDHLHGDDPIERRLSRAFDAWFAYVQTHPYAWRMLFRDTTGDRDIEAAHREIANRSRALMLSLLAGEAAATGLAGSDRPDPEPGLEMTWEVMRGALQGLASWWYEHPRTPRAQVVATAMNMLWVGLERLQRGEGWRV